MNARTLCLVFLGAVLAVSVGLILPSSVLASPTTVLIQQPAGTYTPPSSFIPGSGGLQTVIGFDTLSGGGTIANDTDIRTQYLAAYGVQFSLVGSSTSGKLVAKKANNMAGGYDWGDDSITSGNTLTSWNSVVSGAPVTVRIDFIPQGTQLLPRAAGLVFTDSPQNDVFTLKAYNAVGTLIGTVTSNTADAKYNSTGHAEDRFLGFQFYDSNDPNLGIARLEYTMKTNSAGTIIGNEIDNVTFETRFGSTPEPATLALLGIGGATLLRRRLRRSGR
jgi:hypothetical protein